MKKGILYNLNSNIMSLNNSKYFAGLVMIMLNLGSKYITVKFSKSQEAYLRNILGRQILIFSVAWMGTRDIYIALFIMGCFVIVSDFLFDEESMFCILPDEFKDHHLTILEENEAKQNVTEEEIANAKKVLEKAKEQKKDNELESYKI